MRSWEYDAAQRKVPQQVVLKQDPKFELLKKQLRIEEQSGILRCVGRLSNSDMDFESKFPVILPKNHRFTELVVLRVFVSL